MQCLPAVDGGDQIGDTYLARRRVHVHIDDRTRPRVHRICVAAVGGLVPMDRIGLDVGFFDAERRHLTLQPLLERSRRVLDQATDDHRGARGNSGAGIGDE